MNEETPRITVEEQDRLRLAAGWKLLHAPPVFIHCWLTDDIEDPAPDELLRPGDTQEKQR